MATNMFKKYTESLCREWDVPSGTLSGTIVLRGTEVGITLTARGDAVKTATLPDGSTVTGVAGSGGGVGNRPTGAVVARDGSWLLTVAGVTNGGTESGAAGTDAGTAVYRVTADGTYSLTGTSAVFIGRIDDGTIVGGVAPVQIGIS